MIKLSLIYQVTSLVINSFKYVWVNENCPKNILKLFSSIKGIHSYETRSAFDKLYTQSSRLKMQLNSFSRIGVRELSSVRERYKFTFEKIIVSEKNSFPLFRVRSAIWELKFLEWPKFIVPLTKTSK